MKGFSLLETTIAIAILVTAVVGPLTLASSSIKASSLAKNNLIAANLAQEGVELIKNRRANNIFGGQGWLSGFDSCFGASGCTIDAVTFEVGPCGASCPKLNIDESGLHSYSDGTPTMFTRKINIESVSASEVKIKSSVMWLERFGEHRFELEAYMLNW